ncbi:TPA: hypothetical protein NK336_001149 [Vibrio parahaemolyticus]|nr:hypothetical protein [Vibrio parahaemolyticus]HCH6247582.1 hypothetical protein [Vibrio parahaemolyticus]
MNDIKQKMKILIAKMHEYGFEEIAINNDVPAMDQEFAKALVNYLEATSNAFLSVSRLHKLAKQRDFKVLSENLEQDLKTLAGMASMIGNTCNSYGRMEIEAFDVALEALHRAKEESKFSAC